MAREDLGLLIADEAGAACQLLGTLALALLSEGHLLSCELGLGLLEREDEGKHLLAELDLGYLASARLDLQLRYLLSDAFSLVALELLLQVRHPEGLRLSVLDALLGLCDLLENQLALRLPQQKALEVLDLAQCVCLQLLILLFRERLIVLDLF